MTTKDVAWSTISKSSLKQEKDRRTVISITLTEPQVPILVFTVHGNLAALQAEVSSLHKIESSFKLTAQQLASEKVNKQCKDALQAPK